MGQALATDLRLNATYVTRLPFHISNQQGHATAFNWQRHNYRDKRHKRWLLTYISPDFPRLLSLLHCFFIILQTSLHEEASQRESQECWNPKKKLHRKAFVPSSSTGHLGREDCTTQKITSRGNLCPLIGYKWTQEVRHANSRLSPTCRTLAMGSLFAGQYVVTT